MIERHIPFRGYYRVLDLGCAEGKTLLDLRRLLGGRGEFVGIEAAPSLLARAPDFPSDTRLLEGDVCDLPETISDASFDVVSALAVLEHLEDPESLGRQAALKLKPGGLFVATCPHPGWDRLASLSKIAGGEAHHSTMDRSRMLRVAEQVGEAHFEPFMTASLGVLPYLRFPVSVELSHRVDRIVGKIPGPLTRHLFVNQVVVATKPK
jgi:SAM-dependent methyltransferase